ncbi:hypothetical protein M406DRAFT_353270 [Cryphonectria parasitica EP155]|uniref:Mid2 domain-containing protein n=1 Tax=Cryphonectria parasitica (strain ATCC 38755 / EP155) TaxID=660469 RepID=A0A9P5CK92_CRYP1|nr:uncharacterized protein M406DRAFT_353270 [Cryphonectria parasitica EP155]KAF3761808.1 hypothetical protein M406DRAFT_353270 [Cryphonectria parasitica EP155]
MMPSSWSQWRALILAAASLSPKQKRTTTSGQYATWIYPADDTETFYYRDQIDVTYQCSSSASSYLVVNCYQGIGDVQQQQVAPGGDATVGITLQLSNGSSYSENEDLSCWFDLRNVSGYAGVANGSNSPSWNYIHTERSGGPATLALPSSSSQSVAATTSTTSTTSQTATTATPTSARDRTSAAAADATKATATTTAIPNKSSGSLSVGAGVAIGVSVGVLAVAVPLVSLVFIRRQRKRRQQLDEVRRRVGFDDGAPPREQHVQPSSAGFKFRGSEPPGYSYFSGKNDPSRGVSGGSYPLREVTSTREVYELYGSQAGEELEVPATRRAAVPPADLRP